MKERDDELIASVARLCDLEVEYDLTLRVLAVVAERLQDATDSREIQVSDEALADQPDLKAWRDDEGLIRLQVSR